MSVSGTEQQRIVRSASNVITMVRATTTTTNTWYELIASTSSAIWITSLVGLVASNNVAELGTGAAGAEVTVATTYLGMSGGTYDMVYQSLTLPIRVPASTRVAIRCTTAGSSTTVVGIQYVAESAVA